MPIYCLRIKKKKEEKTVLPAASKICYEFSKSVDEYSVYGIWFQIFVLIHF